MAKLRTDSRLSRRITRAFIDFLDSVEPAQGVDVEGIEVARECLTQAFNLESSSSFSPDDDVDTPPGLLIELFRTLASKSDASTPPPPSTDPINPPGEDWTKQPGGSGVSKDELFGQFFAALEKNHFFRTMPDGSDDLVQLDKATRLFHDAVHELEKSGCPSYDRNSLADVLKSQGNKAMQLKLYTDAIELYSCAISLCEDNAVYYCNRAAAYTQISKYSEAIRDSLKSIEIDPNYSKAYSRLGLAYYAQGNYRDAIDKGFKKALQLDPNNESVRENIRVSEQKLKEEQQHRERDQNADSSSHDSQQSNPNTGGSWNHGMPPPFESMPFDINGIPVDFTSMLRNMSANVHVAEQHNQNNGPREEDANVNGSDEPGIRLGGNINLNGGNINLNFAENMPQDISGALRSVMEMFSGAGNPHSNSQDTSNGGRPATS